MPRAGRFSGPSRRTGPPPIPELVKGILEVDDSLRVRGTDLWLDPPKRKPLAFVSHAHSDHLMRKHDQVILSLNTARFYQRKYPDADVTALAFEEKYRIGDTTIELFPAGHILGSAQICLEVQGLRVVYTGDVKLSASFTAERVKIRPCDVLIIESTYGEPRYVFPKREEVAEDLLRFVRNCFARKITPVVLAYTIGKAQEAIKVLGDAGITCRLEKSIFDATEIYRELGVDLINYRPFPPFTPGSEVIVVPPWRPDLVKSIPNTRTVFLSGWALDPKRVEEVGADEGIPFSDHADYAELLVYIQLAKPARVYTVHGSGIFAKLLRQQGIAAQHVEVKAVQPTLWGYI